MAETFEVGDVVQLMSGGESMTVEAVEDNDISCVWFEGKKVQRGRFVAGSLKKYIPPSAGIWSLERG